MPLFNFLAPSFFIARCFAARVDVLTALLFVGPPMNQHLSGSVIGVNLL